jgi:hypothetical protein
MPRTNAAPRPVEAVTTPEGVEAALSDWRRRPRPVVFRRQLALRRDWSLASLVRELGDVRLLFNGPDGFGLHPLRRLLEDDADAVYVANSEGLLAARPELIRELGLEPWRRRLGLVPYCVQLFLGARPRTGLTYHCANNVNLFLMLHGRKRWTFVDPAWSYGMYPWVTRSGAYVASIVGHRELSPDDQVLVEACPRWQVELEPGDVLLNPPWWWHEVENLDAETVGCATRWSGPGIAETNRLFSFAQTLTPAVWRETARTLASLLEAGGDLVDLYRSQAGGAVTAIEQVSHTEEQYQAGALGRRGWPHPASPPRRR